MNEEAISLVLGLFCVGVFFVFPLLFSFLVGRARERAHFAQLDAHERELAHVKLTTVRDPSAAFLGHDAPIERVALVSGNVVVASDSWKRFTAAWKTLVGGNLRSLEPMMIRGRREALVRLQRDARARGFDRVVGVRLETSELSSSSANKNQQSITGLEVCAYGTAVR